jgi:hypothetical protein
MALDDIRADIAYVKDLVDDGGDGERLRGGIWMVVAGVVFSITSVVVWWTVSQRLAAGWWIAGIWFAGSLVCNLLGMTLTARLPRARGTPGRALKSVGVAISLTLSALFGAGIVASAVTQNYGVWALFPSIVFAVYGAFWYGSAVITRERWRHIVAAGSCFAAVLFPIVSNRLESCLLFAALLTLLATLPGIVILRTKRA